MKNIHVLPTETPSRLYIHSVKGLLLNTVKHKDTGYNQNIYITSEEEIKEGDWVIDDENKVFQIKSLETLHDGKIIVNCGKADLTENWLKDCKKINLTSDLNLINDDVQAIPDEFLEWFVKNPSCESVEIKEDECSWFVNGGKDIEYRKYNYIEIPKLPQQEQETLEEAAEIFVNNRFAKQISGDKTYPDIYASKEAIVESHILFAKHQQGRSYSEEEMIRAIELAQSRASIAYDSDGDSSGVKHYYEVKDVMKIINLKQQ